MSFNYTIKETIGIISRKLNGETLELKIIRYGHYEKFDLRRWSDNVMYKGITLNMDELKTLKTLLNQYLTNDNTSLNDSETFINYSKSNNKKE